MTLQAGRTYTITVNAGYALISILDRNSRVVVKGQSHTSAPGVLDYRPRTRGTYYFAIGEGENSYTLSMR